MKDKTQMMKILETLDREGHLSSLKISEISGVPRGTCRCYMSLLTRSGLVKPHKSLRGIYEITPAGQKFLAEKGGD